MNFRGKHKEHGLIDLDIKENDLDESKPPHIREEFTPSRLDLAKNFVYKRFTIMGSELGGLDRHSKVLKKEFSFFKPKVSLIFSSSTLTKPKKYVTCKGLVLRSDQA